MARRTPKQKRRKIFYDEPDEKLLKKEVKDHNKKPVLAKYEGKHIDAIRAYRGRPKEMTPEIVEIIIDIIIDTMAGGGSKTEVFAKLGTVPTVFWVWSKKYPQIKNAVDYGEMLSLNWWINKGKSNLNNMTFNNNLYKSIMMNLHGWRTKIDAPGMVQVNNNSNNTTTIDNREQRIDWSKLNAHELKGIKKLVQKSITDTAEDQPRAILQESEDVY